MKTKRGEAGELFRDTLRRVMIDVEAVHLGFMLFVQNDPRGPRPPRAGICYVVDQCKCKAQVDEMRVIDSSRVNSNRNS